MKKGTRLIKRAISLLLVLLFSIESFAAIVSDNDGSAFITKTEFDSLKNDFQAQIDNYNTSIDSKIDGAIAAYLAGIRLQAEEVSDLIYNDWKKVTCMNFKPSLTYQLCNLNLSYSQNTGNGSSGWTETSYLRAVVKYDRPDTDENKQKILLCDASIDTKGIEVKDDPKKIQWKGRTYNYKDSLANSQVFTDRGTYYSGVQNASIKLEKYINFKCGYYADPSDAARTIWGPQFWYDNTNSSYRKWVQAGDRNYSSVSGAVELELDSDGNMVDYEHVIHYSNLTDMQFADNKWVKHITKNPEKTTKDYPKRGNDGMTVDSQYRISEGHTTYADSGHMIEGTPKEYWPGSAGEGESPEKEIPLIGLLSSKYQSKDIYQSDKVIKVSVDRSELGTEEIPLILDGFPLLAAKDGDTITWEPKFIDSKVGDKDTSSEIYLRLAVGGFGENESLKTNTGKYCKDKKNDKDYFIIKNGSGKIQFSMPMDGIVYAKWRHNPVATEGTNWEITLDIENCSTYKREKAQ